MYEVSNTSPHVRGFGIDDCKEEGNLLKDFRVGAVGIVKAWRVNEIDGSVVVTGKAVDADIHCACVKISGIPEVPIGNGHESRSCPIWTGWLANSDINVLFPEPVTPIIATTTSFSLLRLQRCFQIKKSRDKPQTGHVPLLQSAAIRVKA
jgi:hypothetical protein